jgi:hypothetical protein
LTGKASRRRIRGEGEGAVGFVGVGGGRHGCFVVLLGVAWGLGLDWADSVGPWASRVSWAIVGSQQIDYFHVGINSTKSLSG